MGYTYTRREREMYDFLSTSQIHSGDNIQIDGTKIIFLEVEEEEDGLRTWYRCSSLLWISEPSASPVVIYVGVASSDDGAEIMYDENSPLGEFLSEEC